MWKRRSGPVKDKFTFFEYFLQLPLYSITHIKTLWKMHIFLILKKDFNLILTSSRLFECSIQNISLENCFVSTFCRLLNLKTIHSSYIYTFKLKFKLLLTMYN